MRKIDKKIIIKAIVYSLTISNAGVGAVYLLSQMMIDFNFIVGMIYFIVSVLSLYYIALTKE
jgi:hypothetical protein